MINTDINGNIEAIPNKSKRLEIKFKNNINTALFFSD